MELLPGNGLPIIWTHSRRLWPFLLIPLIVVAPFLFIGLSQAYQVVRQERNWISAPGTVVDNIIVARATGAAYSPVVEFRTMEGVTVRFTDDVGTIPPEYEVGAKVKVLYDPNDAQNAQLVSWMRLWLGPTLLIGSGLLPVLVAAFVLWLEGRRAGSSSRLTYRFQ
jgi:hypothetical protein